MKPSTETIALAERVLALHGPVMVACPLCAGHGHWNPAEDDGCGGCAGTGQRHLTAVELATPEPDGRPGAHLWALWAGRGVTLTTPRAPARLWRAMSLRSMVVGGATATHAMLAALAAAGEPTP